MSKWIRNTQPYVQKLSGPFTWDNFGNGLCEARKQMPQWAKTGPSQPTWRERGGVSCSIHPSRLRDVQGWRNTGGPATQIVNTARLAPHGSTELQVDENLSVMLDHDIPLGEVHWHAYWEKI